MVYKAWYITVYTYSISEHIQMMVYSCRISEHMMVYTYSISEHIQMMVDYYGNCLILWAWM